MLKPIKTIITTKESKSIEGVGIPKGTTLYVLWIGDKAPFGDGHRLMKCRVDNGTGDLKLMPECVIRDKEVGFEEILKVKCLKCQKETAVTRKDWDKGTEFICKCGGTRKREK